MTNEEVIARLREDDTDFWHCEAADRIEALTAELTLAEQRGYSNAMEAERKLHEDRIEALTEQLEAARADAKEAEAYAEGLERDLKNCRMAQAVMDNTVAELKRERDTLRLVIEANIEKHRSRAEAAEAKLAKAVEALREIEADCDADYPPSHGAIKHAIRAVLAELEGEG
jgi:chromosome segregation ATPase